MEQQDQLLLEPLLNQNTAKRRNLLPLWMKVFIWIFMAFGALAPVCFLLGIAGTTFQVALYGLQSAEPLSAIGMLVILLFLFKGIVAYGLWTEKEWAIKFGLIDAITGIVICIYVMLLAPLANNQPGFVINFRLELLALIPYFLKLRKLKAQW